MSESNAKRDTDRPGPLEEGTGEGIDVTVGEPNTFEPEEDPDAKPEAIDPQI
jgi:hypothetical protein